MPSACSEIGSRRVAFDRAGAKMAKLQGTSSRFQKGQTRVPRILVDPLEPGVVGLGLWDPL